MRTGSPGSGSDGTFQTYAFQSHPAGRDWKNCSFAGRVAAGQGNCSDLEEILVLSGLPSALRRMSETSYTPACWEKV